jgi:hypothetical protein
MRKVERLASAGKKCMALLTLAYKTSWVLHIEVAWPLVTGSGTVGAAGHNTSLKLPTRANDITYDFQKMVEAHQ